MRKYILIFLIFFMASPVGAEEGFVSIMTPITVPSAESGVSVVEMAVSSVVLEDFQDYILGDPTGISFQIGEEKAIKQKIGAATVTSYRHVGDMPLTRAVLGSVNFNLNFWPEVLSALSQYMGSETYNTAQSNSTKDLQDIIPRAQAVTEHAQNIIPNIVIPLSLALLGVMFCIQVISTYLSKNTTTTHFFTDIARFMFFFILIMTYRIWVSLAIDIFNFASYLIAPWGAQESMQHAIAKLGNGASIADWASLTNILNAILRWIAYMSIRVLLISRDVLLAVCLVIGPFCIAIGFVSFYSRNDVLKSFLSGWMQSFFKLQFWGVFAAITMIGLSMVGFISNVSQSDLLVVAITGIAFVHAAFNIPRLADNMSAVVISSVLMATLSMAVGRSTGAATSTGAGAAKAGISRLFRR